jgi:hypothetical protein
MSAEAKISVKNVVARENDRSATGIVQWGPSNALTSLVLLGQHIGMSFEEYETPYIKPNIESGRMSNVRNSENDVNKPPICFWQRLHTRRKEQDGETVNGFWLNLNPRTSFHPRFFELVIKNPGRYSSRECSDESEEST